MNVVLASTLVRDHGWAPRATAAVCQIERRLWQAVIAEPGVPWVFLIAPDPSGGGWVTTVTDSPTCSTLHSRVFEPDSWVVVDLERVLARVRGAR